TLDAAQVSGSGVPLDGEMTGNPVVLPSGDGTFGGDAVFYVGNMAGDVDGDRVVRLGDAVLAREQANPFLPVLIDNVFDVDKDGVVRLGDAVLIREESNPFLGLPLISP
ncbi:MAG: hypothetical protein ACE5EX_11860, partial [Phycisphaerae bacterium]